MSALLAISGLTRRFSIASPRLFGKPSVLTALDNVSVTLGPGETLGVVGESGSGKSTMARLALGIDRASSGSVSLFGQDVTALSTAEWRIFRRRAQYVFQDSSGSLNPRMTAGEQIREGLEIHDIGTASDRARAVEDALAAVRLDPALADRYPHELSGGQQQRVVIARAIVLKPELLVADEPVSALDLTVQAEIVDLLSGFQKTSGTAMMLISHDLNVVRRMADRVVVLYLGRVVEEGETQALYAAPRHPYTAALLSAAPRPRHHHIRAPRLRLKGDTPNALTLPSGCALHPRCPFAIERCRSERPELSGPEAFGTGGHRAACHRADEVPGLVARYFSGEPVHA